MLSSDFLFPRFFVVPLANPSNFSHCKCFSSRIYLVCACAASSMQGRVIGVCRFVKNKLFERTRHFHRLLYANETVVEK